MKTNFEHKEINLEFKDMDRGKRTAVIAHAVYNSIDRVGDISTKGMFNKSWKEYKNIDFLFNHDKSEIVGNVLSVFEDEHKAYTEVKFGRWALGDDVLEMADAGVLRGASFGYITEKKSFENIKGRKIRKLQEVIHLETSLVTTTPVHPDAGVVKLNKSLSEEDAAAIQGHIDLMEKFCRDTKASDECIIGILKEIQEAKSVLLKYNTVDTHDDEQPISGNNEDEKALANSLYLLTLKTFS